MWKRHRCKEITFYDERYLAKKSFLKNFFEKYFRREGIKCVYRWSKDVSMENSDDNLGPKQSSIVTNPVMMALDKRRWEPGCLVFTQGKHPTCLVATFIT